MSVEACADVVLVFSCPQFVCELDPSLWRLVADAVLVFSCPQDVCELDPCLWRLVLMLSLCFPALSRCVNLIHVCGNLC